MRARASVAFSRCLTRSAWARPSSIELSAASASFKNSRTPALKARTSARSGVSAGPFFASVAESVEQPARTAAAAKRADRISRTPETIRRLPPALSSARELLLFLLQLFLQEIEDNLGGARRAALRLPPALLPMAQGIDRDVQPLAKVLLFFAVGASQRPNAFRGPFHLRFPPRNHCKNPRRKALVNFRSFSLDASPNFY